MTAVYFELLYRDGRHDMLCVCRKGRSYVYDLAKCVRVLGLESGTRRALRLSVRGAKR